MLCDFGLSKLVGRGYGRSYLISQLAGSVRYAAPELFPKDNDDLQLEELLSTSCDIYSFGAVMFEVRSAHHQFAHVVVA